MKHIVSFSGGRTSAYLCSLIKEMHPDADFIFMDTGAEHPLTYKFIKECNDYFNLNLTCLRVVVNPDKRKGVGYKVVDINEIQQDLQHILRYV